MNLEIESDSFLESESSCLSFNFSVSLLPISSNSQVQSLIQNKEQKSVTSKENPFDGPSKDLNVPEMPEAIIDNSEDEEEGEFGVVIKKPKKEEADDEIEDISEQKDVQKTEEVEPSKATPVDVLEITFKKNGELPEEVGKHIESRIGMFQKNENEEEGTTTLTFEVNFHQIDKYEIWQSYQRFFEQKDNSEEKNMHFKLSFQKNGELNDLFNSFKKDPEIPLVLHLIENSRLKLDSEGPEYLIKTGMNYLKSHMKHEMAFLDLLINNFKGIKGKLKLGALHDISKDFWQRLDLDQTQNFGGFFDVWRTPLLNYIFGEGEGKLLVKGTVFNYIAYEFEMNIKDFAQFLSQIKEEFK
jgi:hypothetical protein